MTILLTTLMLAPQIEPPAPIAGGARQRMGVVSDTSLLVDAAVPLSAEQLVFHYEAVRTVRLAWLDQWLALTAKQRGTLKTKLAKVKRKNNRWMVMGPVLEPAELRSVLTDAQKQAMVSETSSGTQHEIMEQAYRSAGGLLVERVCEDLQCTDKQRRRLELAVRGGWKRFLAKHERDFATASSLTTIGPFRSNVMLLIQRRPGPLIAELEFWQKALRSTLTSEQLERYDELEASRAVLFRKANAVGPTASMQIDHDLTTDQCRKLASLLASRSSEKDRLVYPLLLPSYPVLRLTERNLRANLPEEKATAIAHELKDLSEFIKSISADKPAGAR